MIAPAYINEQPANIMAIDNQPVNFEESLTQTRFLNAKNALPILIGGISGYEIGGVKGAFLGAAAAGFLYPKIRKHFYQGEQEPNSYPAISEQPEVVVVAQTPAAPAVTYENMPKPKHIKNSLRYLGDRALGTLFGGFVGVVGGALVDKSDSITVDKTSVIGAALGSLGSIGLQAYKSRKHRKLSYF